MTAQRRDGSGNDAAVAWLIPGVAAVAAVVSFALWAGAGLASTLTGRGWPAPSLSPLLVVRLVRAGGRPGCGPVWTLG